MRLCTTLALIAAAMPQLASLPRAAAQEPQGWRAALQQRMGKLREAMEDPAPTADERLESVIGLLVSELGGPLPSGGAQRLSPSERYQDALIATLARCAPCDALVRRASASPDETLSAEARIRLLFAASEADRADASAATQALLISELTALLRESPSDYVRSRAARALGLLGARSAEADLTRALADPTARSEVIPGYGLEPMPVYLVRMEAAFALERLGHEIAHPGPDMWVVDPPLVTGVQAKDLLGELGHDAVPAGVNRSGVVWRWTGTPEGSVALAVLPSLAAAHELWFELADVSAAAPDMSVGDVGEAAAGWSMGSVRLLRRNCVVTVACGHYAQAVDVARQIDARLADGGEWVQTGRPVTVPEIALEGVPEAARGGDSLRVGYHCAERELLGPGDARRGRDGAVHILVRETEPGFYVRTFDFATPECVMVRKTVIIKVVPWEDDAPEQAEEE